MKENPQRFAWAILLISLVACIGLSAAIPLGARYYIRNARVNHDVTLEVQRPPVRVTEPRSSRPVAISEDSEIDLQTTVATDSTTGRIVMAVPRKGGPVVATIQLYDNTSIELDTAHSPRFESSPLAHQVAVTVRAGRVRVNVHDDENRPTHFEIETSHGRIVLTDGSYEVKVNAATEVTARYGKAEVQKGDQRSQLWPSERAIIDRERIKGPLPASRNLIDNGDFQSPLSTGWISYTEVNNQETSLSIEVVNNEEREVVQFYSEAENHVEGGIYQPINYDVRDFTSLELHMAVRILHQNIVGFGGCGYLSSECPIFVRIDYKDVEGTDRQWLYGFYTGDPAPDWLLHPWTEQIPLDSWQTYDSENLIEEMGNPPPASIKRITIYASGHSFHAMVTEVELLAQE